jgi:PST family polysaccharide transporter
MNKIKSLIRRFNGSKDQKTLASNFGYLMLLQIAGYVFPLITIPYLARVIGVEGFGKIAFAAAVVVWFQTVSDWGFNYTATRDVARNRDNMEEVSKIFSNVLWARILLMVVSFVILFFLTEMIPYFKEHQAILLVTFLIVPGHIMFPDWFFQAMERMKYITIFNLVSKALFTALVFVLIKEKQDYILQPLLMSLGYLVCGIGAMYIILAKWKIKLYAPHWSPIKQTISSSTDVFINNMVPNLYNSFSTVLLGFYGGSTANGLLDAGRKFVEIGQQFLNIISRVFFPFLSRHNSKADKHSLYMKINLSVAICGSILLFLFAPLIIDFFFTSEFEEATNVLRIMAVSLIFLSLSNIYGINFLIIRGYEKELRNITLGCSIIGFVTAFPLVYFYSYIGAALNILITRTLLGLGIMIIAKYINKRETL